MVVLVEVLVVVEERGRLDEEVATAATAASAEVKVEVSFLAMVVVEVVVVMVARRVAAEETLASEDVVEGRVRLSVLLAVGAAVGVVVVESWTLLLLRRVLILAGAEASFIGTRREVDVVVVVVLEGDSVVVATVEVVVEASLTTLEGMPLMVA